MKLAFAGIRHGHVIGLYRAARAHEGVTVAGAWEEDCQAAQDARTVMDVPFYVSYEDLLADQTVDAVAVGDYYGIRARRIVRALEAGKHVICDKPLCVSLDELETISRLSLEKKLHVDCMLDLRYDPAVNEARRMVRSGRLGRIHAVNFTGQHPLNYGVRPMWYFEAGKHGGVINDIAIHGLDAVRYITGLDFVRSVAARTWNAFAVQEPDFKDCGQFMAEFEGGAGVTGDVSYAAQSGLADKMPSYWRFTFWGEDGSLEFKVGTDQLIYAARGADDLQMIAASSVQSGWLDDFLKPFDEGAQRDVFASQHAVLSVQADAR